ncbi:MAG TPA: twin-arginine translocase TatA/TatE family subunit [Candidatus Eisenbacteria bacterium]
MFNIGPQELFWLFLIVLLVFGAKRIPEIGRSIGRGIQEFKKGMRDVETEINVSDKPGPTPPAPTPTQGPSEERKS